MHELHAIIRNADDAINREDLDAVVFTRAKGPRWLCAVDNSYGTSLLRDWNGDEQP